VDETLDFNHYMLTSPAPSIGSANPNNAKLQPGGVNQSAALNVSHVSTSEQQVTCDKLSPKLAHSGTKRFKTESAN